MSNYRFERLNDDNITDLPVIFQSAYGQQTSIDRLRKKFDTSVFGNKNVGFIAYDEKGEPSAFYGVFPCYITLNGKKIYAAQSGDTMTHKNHQGKGLFVSLAKETYALARQLGIKVVFGFPNENSYPGFVRKLDWQHPEDMKAYLIRVACIPLVRIKKMTGLSDQYHHRLFLAQLRKLEPGRPFKSSVIDEQWGGVDHSEAFFRYKTYEENHLVKIAGKSIWLKREGMFLMIGDIERCNNREFNQVIHRLKSICFWSGLPYIRFHTSGNTLMETQVLEAGAVRHHQSYPVGYADFGSGIDMKRIKFTMSDNDNF